MTSAAAATVSATVCPACAHQKYSYTKSVGHNAYRLLRCANCNLSFSDPMRGADSDWYATSWLYGLREAGTRRSGVGSRVPWHLSKAISSLRNRPKGDLLDIGCAEGEFLALARAEGYQVTGLDFNPNSLEIAKRTFALSSLYQCSAEDLHKQFPDWRFDVITMLEVLEHTATPFEILCSIKDLLKPGGRFILSVPGSRRWPALFHPEVDAPPHHLTLWTEPALQSILERAGFRAISLCRKPLGPDDLGIHIKWRLHRMLQQVRKPQPVHSSSGFSLQNPNSRSPVGREGLVRLGSFGLWPVSQLLKVHPRSGGFTIFAECEGP